MYKNIEQSKLKWPKIIAISMTVILLLLGLFALVSGLMYDNFLKSPSSMEKKEVLFVIEQGESVRTIVDHLKIDGLINNNFLFLAHLKISNQSSKLKAGAYLLNTNNTPLQIISSLVGGKTKNHKMTIPEGWTIEDIGNFLEKNNVVSKKEFIAATLKDYNYDFLKDKPAGVDLEGYLFPDTYELPAVPTAEGIVKMMLDNFDKRVTSDLRNQSKETGLNFHQIITLASIVEREVATADDRKLVAGVFKKRLDIGMRLESCATIQYILKSNKTRFTYEETRVESPFNTYIKDGLPPGPIASPGLDSIKATISPEITDYLYFFAKDGKTYYSSTQEEHDFKVSQYLN